MKYLGLGTAKGTIERWAKNPDSLDSVPHMMLIGFLGQAEFG
jgi:hypothetical protein